MDPRSPVRTCIGCRVRFGCDELVRVSLDESGTLVTGRHGHGRGAWLCRRRACVEQAHRRKAFGRALRATVRSEDLATIITALEGELSDEPVPPAGGHS